MYPFAALVLQLFNKEIRARRAISVVGPIGTMVPLPTMQILRFVFGLQSFEKGTVP